MPLTRKEIAQLIGKVFIQKSAVNLLSTVLDTPEFFWSAPDSMQVRSCPLSGDQALPGSHNTSTQSAVSSLPHSDAERGSLLPNCGRCLSLSHTAHECRLVQQGGHGQPFLSSLVLRPPFVIGELCA